MPILLPASHPSILLRREAWERSGLTRAAVDARLGLTDEEFQVEDRLVCIGPIHATGELHVFIDSLEASGLRHFEDFFDLSGNWPSWLRLYAVSPRET
ncbi:MAG: hypothetical protein MNPFHGCM_00114 [Gemmatimonadaceae bacterium]|nr:hypothetical protein [Gemmatimonadaceae bacterium]